MKKISDVIEWFTRRNTKTILNPRSILDGHIACSTVPKNYFNCYIIDKNSLDVSESGGLMMHLPSKSNIREIEGQLNRLSKEYDGFRGSSEKPQPKHNQISWIDGFNRYMATRNETSEGISYILRADVANHLAQKGKLLVQCDESFCDVLIPTKVSVDLNKYSVAIESEENSGL